MNQEEKELQNNYIFAIDRLVNTDLNAKSNYISNLSLLDKLFNDYLGYALLTLGAAIGVLTAKPSLIKTNVTFVAALILLGFVIILCSYVRSKIHDIVSKASQLLLEEYNGKLRAIDSYRINPTPENQGVLNTKLQEQKFLPSNLWFESKGSVLLVTVYIASVLLVIISLAFEIRV